MALSDIHLDSIDFSELESVTDRDLELTKALVEEFAVSCRGCVARLQESIQLNDLEQWQRSLHALKGVSLGLGAYGLAKTCEAMKKNTDASALSYLQQQIDQTQQALEKYTQQL